MRRAAGRRLLALSALIATATSLVVARQAQQSPTFRATLDLVTMDVSVRQGNIAVTGLGVDDFEITDNGVPQTVDAVSTQLLPIDLTLLIDESGSTEPFRTQLLADARDVTTMLRDDDRMRLLTMTTVVLEVSPFQPASEPLDFDLGPRSGMTVPLPGVEALYDAVAAALMRTRTPDRHELVVVLTDGDNSQSTISGETLVGIAQRSDAILQVIWMEGTGGLPNLDRPDHSNRNRLFWGAFRGENRDNTKRWVREAADTTGGGLLTVFGEAGQRSRLQAAIDRMRTNYIVQYAARNVPRPGWHDIKVKLKREGSFDIRTRKGYFGGADGGTEVRPGR